MPLKNAYLLLGSNLGDRALNLRAAREHIAAQAGKVAEKSAIYETAAWGKEDQPAFLNQAIRVETALLPLELLRVLKEIESIIGRKQTTRWGARLIDIDILLLGTHVFQADNLTIPHKHMHERRFTLMPLAEIAADTVHPVLKLPIGKLLEQCPDRLEVRLFKQPKNKLSA